MAISGALVCPRCGGRMQPYERSEIPVDECEDCRGIFLDQGELERLIDAEGGGWSGRIIPPRSVDRPREIQRRADSRRTAIREGGAASARPRGHHHERE